MLKAVDEFAFPRCSEMRFISEIFEIIYAKKIDRLEYLKQNY